MVAAYFVTSAAVVTALGVWLKKMRPVWKGVMAVHDIIERELTPNGGSSMKDAAMAASKNAAEAKEAALAASAQLRTIMATQGATMTVIDNMNQRNHAEHQEMWDALHTLGYDRRRETS